MSRKDRRPLALVRRAVEVVAHQEAERERVWLQDRLKALPFYWSSFVQAEHLRRGGLESSEANRYVLSVTEEAGGRLPFAVRDDELKSLAGRMARDCLMMAGWHGGVPSAGTYWRCVEVARRLGVEPPKADPCDLAPALRRLACPRWWLRALRRAAARRCEGAAIRGALVRRGLWPYVSQDQLSRRGAQKKRNEKAVEGASLVDLDSAEEIALQEVVARSLANPENRRAEMMVRIRGADEYADIYAHRVEFWTLTCPSRFHAQRVLGATAEANPAYDGRTPKEAQKYLSGVWAKARAAWARRGLQVYGLRTAEPHHDGCPHWHLVVYGPGRDLRFARRLLRVYALRMDRDEPGARAARFKAMALSGGSAGASYAAKYIAKNIDGGNMEGQRDGETGRKVSETARRVDAWAAAWGVRQFQFFGMAAVGVWRALRRMREPVADEGALLEKARRAADSSEWCEYCRVMASGALELMREASGRLTVYGDKAAAVVVGVAEGGRRAWLDRRRWALCWGEAARKSAAQSARRGSWVASGLGFGFPWSGVNNCTGLDFQGAAGRH